MVHMIVNLKTEPKMKTTSLIQSRNKSSSTIFGEIIFLRNLDLNQFGYFRWILKQTLPPEIEKV